MGRQAHVTRLALGRSPFEAPLRDDNDEFILGPHAHDHDASGYTQQYDDRGHPENLSSTAAARKLRRAQNDVLATVGVVVKKGEERRSKWERLDSNQKIDIVYDENGAGGWLLLAGRGCGGVLSWPVASLRKRLMTFTPYHVLPVVSLISTEHRMFGISGTLLAGLPFQLLTTFPLLGRYYGMSPNAEAIVNFINPWRSGPQDETTLAFLQRHLMTTALRCIELPLLVHATLQSLQIVPVTMALPWRSFIPLSSQSPFAIPRMPVAMNMPSIVTFTKALLYTPLCLYLLRDYLHAEIGYRLYILMRQLLVKPDKPDIISATVSDQRETVGETLIPGIGCPWSPWDSEYEKGKRYFGPKSFFGGLRLAFPPIYKLLNMISRGRLARSRGRLTPLLDRQLRANIRQRYWYDRVDLTPVPRRGSPEDMTFRRLVVNQAFEYANLDPTEELVDVKSWTNDVLGPKADVLRVQAPMRRDWVDDEPQPTQSDIAQQARIDNHQYNETVSSLIAEAFRVVPQSDAVIIQASDGEVVMFSQQASTDSTNVAEMDNIRTLQATEVPLEALIQGMRELQPDAEQIPHPDEPQQVPQAPGINPSQPQPLATSTPTPGITRARSLTDPATQASLHNTLRPLRRPTETDDSLAAISQTLRAEVEALQSPRPSQPDPSPLPTTRQETLNETIEHEVTIPEPPLIPLKHRLFRVTMLSNHPADSLAWHASSLLTSFILWPVEAMWLRSVANWAVNNPAMGPFVDPWWAARLGFGVIGQPIGVLGLGAWFGGANTASGRARYMTSILITLGLEAVVRGAVWGAGVWWVRRSRTRYGWGQF